MADRDAEIREAYASAYDAEHGAQLITAGGRTISPDTLLADMARQRQANADRITNAMHRESELAAYNIEDVLELGRHTI